MTRYWCVNFDHRQCLEYGIKKNLWMMQYQYKDDSGNVFQDGNQKAATTANWKRLSLVKAGDKFVAYLPGSLFFAIGTVIEPRTSKSPQDLTDTIEGYVERKRSHDHKSGYIYYTPVFYEDFTDTWRHPDNKLMRYAQRIDVDQWKYFEPDGVTVKGLSEIPVHELHKAVFEINKELFDTIKKALGGVSDEGFVTSRGFALPTDATKMAGFPWFNMWQRRLWPYQELHDGETLYWYDTTLQAIVWKSRVQIAERFEYANKDEAREKLQTFFDMTELNDAYFETASDQGYCIAYKIGSLVRLNVPKPADYKFPQGGWLRCNDELAQDWLKNLLDSEFPDGPATDALSKAATDVIESGYFNAASLKDERTKKLREIVERRGQPEFRNKLIAAYRSRCAVTGCDAVAALEAAHIVPYTGPESHHVTNGLLLRADIHTLFDLDLIGINPESLTISVAKTIKATEYAELEGQKLFLPAAAAEIPNHHALVQRWGRFNQQSDL